MLMILSDKYVFEQIQDLVRAFLDRPEVSIQNEIRIPGFLIRR
jgi:hypothetical protein